jgi:hypothetical protein
LVPVFVLVGLLLDLLLLLLSNQILPLLDLILVLLVEGGSLFIVLIISVIDFSVIFQDALVDDERLECGPDSVGQVQDELFRVPIFIEEFRCLVSVIVPQMKAQLTVVLELYVESVEHAEVLSISLEADPFLILHPFACLHMLAKLGE